MDHVCEYDRSEGTFRPDPGLRLSPKQPVNVIMRYEIDEWTQIGKLLSSRFFHSAIQNGNTIYIIGGIEVHKVIESDNSTLGT